MTIHVLCFGHYSEAYPEPFTVELKAGATLYDALELLTKRDIQFENAKDYCRFAVNEVYAALSNSLSEGDTLAVLPPMSGG